MSRERGHSDRSRPCWTEERPPAPRPAGADADAGGAEDSSAGERECVSCPSAFEGEDPGALFLSPSSGDEEASGGELLRLRRERDCLLFQHRRAQHHRRRLQAQADSLEALIEHAHRERQRLRTALQVAAAAPAGRTAPARLPGASSSRSTRREQRGGTVASPGPRGRGLGRGTHLCAPQPPCAVPRRPWQSALRDGAGPAAPASHPEAPAADLARRPLASRSCLSLGARLRSHPDLPTGSDSAASSPSEPAGEAGPRVPWRQAAAKALDAPDASPSLGSLSTRSGSLAAFSTSSSLASHRSGASLSAALASALEAEDVLGWRRRTGAVPPFDSSLSGAASLHRTSLAAASSCTGSDVRRQGGAKEPSPEPLNRRTARCALLAQRVSTHSFQSALSSKILQRVRGQGAEGPADSEALPCPTQVKAAVVGAAGPAPGPSPGQEFKLLARGSAAHAGSPALEPDVASARPASRASGDGSRGPRCPAAASSTVGGSPRPCPGTGVPCQAPGHPAHAKGVVVPCQASGALQRLRGAAGSPAGAAAEAREPPAPPQPAAPPPLSLARQRRHERESWARRGLAGFSPPPRDCGGAHARGIGGLRVLVRCRPPCLQGAEAAAGAAARGGGEVQGVRVIDATTVEVCEPASGISPKRFRVDGAFGQEASTADVFAAVRCLARAAINGETSAVLAYGPSGSGKTHTMYGSAGDQGLVQRTAAELFGSAGGRPVRISMLELHNETLVDLLVPRGQAPTALEVRGGSIGAVAAVDGARDVPGPSLASLLVTIRSGLARRQVAATMANASSSRSHVIVTFGVGGGKLLLVDLAGLERVKRSGAEGSLLRETQNINRSLQSLGDVVEALRRGWQHVPCRNTKLARLLVGALSGGSETAVVVCVTPDAARSNEALAALCFAERVRRISASPAVDAGAGAPGTAEGA
uniref:Kinesin motor domain-containing protein n=1 Tax=Alexandrium monilatum TaxID=311494 RepID=A0A7S4RPC1_9DINO